MNIHCALRACLLTALLACVPAASMQQEAPPAAASAQAVSGAAVSGAAVSGAAVSGAAVSGAAVSGAASTQAVAGAAVAWASGDLALRLPDGCEQPVLADQDARRLPFVSLTLPCPLLGGSLTLRVYPAQTTAAGAEAGFNDLIAAIALIPMRYAPAPLFGLPGLRGETISADRQTSGLVQSGRLPDGRVLVLASSAVTRPDAPMNTAFTQLLNSIAFSAAGAPTPAQYHLVWQADLGDRVSGLTLHQGWVFAAGENALHLLNRADGAPVGEYLYDRPTHITGIGSEGDTIFVGDTLCRCTQQFSISRRAWIEPVDRFAANAPLDLAAHDGARYAIDLEDTAYRLFRSGTRALVPFEGEQAAPPLLISGTQGIYSVEWVRSVVDGTVNGALILKTDEGDQFVRWLPYAPGELVDGQMYQGTLYGLSREGAAIALSPDDESESVLFADLPAPAAMTLDEQAALYVASDDGTVRALASSSTTGGAAVNSRHGAAALMPDVPVQGYLSEAEPVQQWSYSAQADERLTFNLTETSQANALDAALRVIAPDGRELAFNDDQQGADLFGLLDPQIARLRLPTGTYTVEAQWVGGEGVYTLGVTRERSFTPDARGALELHGTLTDVFPVQHWAFEATAGQALTFTMFGDSGTLDPALTLLRPDERMLAYNDDAYDTELGVNAQIVRVGIPDDGKYILEASRFEGAGAYTIVVVVN